MSKPTTRSRRAGRPPIIRAQTGWREWTVRFRAHMAHHGLTQEKLGIELGKRRPDGKPLSQGAIGHWLTGRNEISLADFFALCEVAKADPMQILFEKHIYRAAVELVQAGAGAKGALDPNAPVGKLAQFIETSASS